MSVGLTASVLWLAELIIDVPFQVTDIDIMKESKLSFYRKNILPILHEKRVVHFVGFGNRLAFDPIPYELQVNLHSFICFSD